MGAKLEEEVREELGELKKVVVGGGVEEMGEVKEPGQVEELEEVEEVQQDILLI